MRFDKILERCYFEKYVLDVSIATLERGGVTSNISTYQFLTSTDAWAVPKYPDKTIRVIPDEYLMQKIVQFIRTNESLLKEPDCWLGTWVDPYTSICHLDITTLYPCLEDARTQALSLNQRAKHAIIALYDCKQQQTVYLREEAIPT
jgi:hypothetical protein